MAPIIWQLISLAIIVLWTARLARAKGMNPLAWGVGSALLMAAGWFLLPEWRSYMVFVGMGPLVFLLLFRSPLFRRSNPAAAATARVAAVSCPRCAAADPGGQNYCVHCGWDLSRPYNESVDSGETAAPAAGPAESVATVLETAADSGAAAATESAPKPAETAPEATATPAASPETPPAAPATAPILAQDTEPPPEPVESAPAAPPPAVRRIPTAANLTEQGIALFGQGRVQEAIDQFTKAIALDPKYRLAWEQRAEAYGRLGRAERQAADRRQLETI